VNAATSDALVAALARSAVAQTAPEELPLFRATSEAYLRDPSSVRARRSAEEMLGFGVDAALVLVTPVALQIARDLVNFVVERVRAKARDRGEEAVDGVLEKLLGGDDGTPKEAAADEAGLDLSDDQLEQVRALALEKAALLELPEDKARLLADSLVGSLATA
jgi:hypothetical protein